MTTYNTERRPVRKIPTREQLAEAARRQALAEQDQESEYELEEDDQYYNTRLPTSSRRYQQIPDGLIPKGRVKVVEHYHDQPLRAHRQQPPPQKSDIPTKLNTSRKNQIAVSIRFYGWVSLVYSLSLAG